MSHASECRSWLGDSWEGRAESTCAAIAGESRAHVLGYHSGRRGGRRWACGGEGAAHSVRSRTLGVGASNSKQLWNGKAPADKLGGPPTWGEQRQQMRVVPWGTSWGPPPITGHHCGSWVQSTRHPVVYCWDGNMRRPSRPSHPDLPYNHAGTALLSSNFPSLPCPLWLLPLP
ncbi:uncharacterized protein N7482_005733 [Penicillium canariense]|uniref:Uncharacterized protein n=1 Tax=Penicillium canariense TaxID=189055 RepID=A0A9W9I8L4_9EURO|nr:uncharacterized protein N7482_005733 [Penicillium canariense]KAJ5166952.1 hypothetical protein N7482_005733 [Penicillium canariense]